MLLLALLHPKSRIVVSAIPMEANPIIKTLVLLNMGKRCYYWAPGGVFHIIIKEKYSKIPYIKLHRVYVQSPSMVEELKKMGFTNAVYA